HAPPVRRQDRRRRHLRPGLPPQARAVDGGDRASPRGRPGRCAAGVRVAERRALTAWSKIPGVKRVEESHGERSLVVEPSRLVEACTHLRDEEGFNFLSDITPTDYLGRAGKGDSGHVATDSRRGLT